MKLYKGLRPLKNEFYNPKVVKADFEHLGLRLLPANHYQFPKKGESMSVRVCDAIMGSGKSSAAIDYMNRHPDKRYIYITPYLDEAARIRRSCPALSFKEPNNTLPEFHFRKYEHTKALIASGENITSTHNMFLRYTDDMVDMIRAQKYTLIIDEAVDVLRPSGLKLGDFCLLEDAGWLNRQGDEVVITPTRDYPDGRFIEAVSLARGNRLVDIDDEECGELYYWLFSTDIILAFEDVIVLTYLFEAQTMKYYFDLKGIPYSKVGIRRDGDGYHFDPDGTYVPGYVRTLHEKIHILESDKLNAIGERTHALSASWYQRLGDDIETQNELKNNVRNFFTNYHRDMPVDKRLWATFESGKKYVRGKGYFYSDTAFNMKATNDFRGRQVLAYCVNIYMHPSEKNYLLKKGVSVLEDRYALSVMIQWIWRSAIRDGCEIWIYVPSRRMRTLLKDWIAEVENYHT